MFLSRFKSWKAVQLLLWLLLLGMFLCGHLPEWPLKKLEEIINGR
jgi:hypothetical protein